MKKVLIAEYLKGFENMAFYLSGERLETIRAEKKRNYILFCDECGKEIREDEKCIYFEFPYNNTLNCGGGFLTSCEKCLSAFMKDITVD